VTILETNNEILVNQTSSIPTTQRESHSIELDTTNKLLGGVLWLVGWFISGLVGWFISGLVGWFISGLVGWFISGLVGWFISGLDGLVSGLLCWLGDL
jgi:cobalamin biosynthesis protein CobD/CbiB